MDIASNIKHGEGSHSLSPMSMSRWQQNKRVNLFSYQRKELLKLTVCIKEYMRRPYPSVP